MSAINHDLKEIELAMVHQGKKIFSGPVKDLLKFNTNEQTVDHVKFFNTDGAFIMSMKYRHFEKIIGDTLP